MVKRYAKDLTGQRFGRLVVIKKGMSYRSPKGSIISQWWCQCDCGSPPILLRRDSLITGNTKSCGCLHEESISIHHGTGTRIYQTWRNMINRCYRKDTDSYYLYGARGIKVCEEWLNNFETFREWAYNNGYNDSLTIERIDNNKNYSPENCCWKTFKEQARHTSRCHYLTYNNETHTISEWSEKLNMNQSTIRYYAEAYGDNVAIEAIIKKYAPNHKDFIFPKTLDNQSDT